MSDFDDIDLSIDELDENTGSSDIKNSENDLEKYGVWV